MVLRVLLAVQCCSCGYGIVCPSYGLYGSISIYYKAGLRVSGYMRTYAYNLTLVFVCNGSNQEYYANEMHPDWTYRNS